METDGGEDGCMEAYLQAGHLEEGGREGGREVGVQTEAIGCRRAC